MPIYTYRCNACHAEFDQLVRSETRVACPECSGRKLERSETRVACPECSGRKLERLMSLTAPPASGGKQADLSRLGPPPSGGCCGGGCHTHTH